MTNNYLISLRNDSDGKGTPGTSVGPTAYIEIPETATTYNLNSKIDPKSWMSRIFDPSVLVFVHGYGNDATKVVARHNAIKPHVPAGFSLVTFDWPSGNPGVMQYRDDKQNAKQTAPNLMSDCLQLLLTRFSPSNVHLFGHSMGAYVTENAFQAPKAIKINHVLMAAADVDRLNYQAGSTFLANFLDKCADLTAYWSTDDQALQDSVKIPINKGAIPLGLNGFPGATIPARCIGIASTKYFENPAKLTPPPPGIPAAEYTHVWYILYQPAPPPVNDFYSDLAKAVQGLPTSATRAPTSDPNGFELQRPK